MKRKITGKVYKIADAIYKLIASSLLEQYGKNSKSICKTIDVHIFGFDEKTKLLGRKIIERSDGRKIWESYEQMHRLLHPEEWQFPLNIKTIAYINCKNKKGAKQSQFPIKSFESENAIPNYIKFLRAQLAYNECIS